MKFRFSLEQVRKWRHHLVQQAETQYRTAQRAREEQEQRIRDIEHHLQELSRPASGEHVQVHFLQRLSSARLAAQRQLAQETRKLEHLRHREEQAHQHLIREQQALEALEKLREKELQRFVERYQRIEAQQLDEIAIGQFVRKSHSHA